MSDRPEGPENPDDPKRERRRIAVIASRYHTLHGETHQEGDVYDIDEDDLPTLQNQGMAHRKDPAPTTEPEPK